MNRFMSVLILVLFITPYVFQEDCYKLLGQVLAEAGRIQDDFKRKDYDRLVDDFLYFTSHLY